MSAGQDAFTTAEVVVEGSLLKVSAHKHALRDRYVRIYATGKLEYWATKPTSSEEGTPKGSGIVVAAEEWWPKPGSESPAPEHDPPVVSSWFPPTHQEPCPNDSLLSTDKALDRVQQLGLKLARASHASEVCSDPSYDGRAFSVRLADQQPIFLVAPSRAARREWLSALALHVQPTSAAPDAAGSVAAAPCAAETATGDEDDEERRSGGGGSSSSGSSDSGQAPAPATPEPATSQAAAGEDDAELQSILAELPSVWTSWSERGLYEDAEARYAELLARRPACWQLLQDRGNFHLHRREYRRADADFSSALELAPTRPELWNDRAACRTQAEQHEDARLDLETALQLRPNFAEALSNLGNVHRELGEKERAKAAYNAALLLNPRDARTWNNRGALQEEVRPARGALSCPLLSPPRALCHDPRACTHVDASAARTHRLARLITMTVWPTCRPSARARALTPLQMGNLVAAELDICRAIELGGCAKAEENRARIAAHLAESETELRVLPACRLAHRRAGAVLWFEMGEGPLGLFLVNAGAPGAEAAATAAASASAGAAAEGEVVIASVYDDSQAARAGVPVGGVVVGLNGSTVGRMSHVELTRRIVTSPRPLSLQVRCPPPPPGPGGEEPGLGPAERDPAVHGYAIAPGGVSDLGAGYGEAPALDGGMGVGDS